MNSIRRFSVVVSALVVCASLARAQGGVPDLSARSLEIPNWAAPPYWNPPAQPLSLDEREGGLRTEGVLPLSTSPLPFIAITPCRVVDTRGNGFTGTYGPPALVGNGPARTFNIPAGPCPGIPATAGAFSINVAAILPASDGFMTVFPTGAAQPTSSDLNFLGGEVIGNAIVAPAGTGGSISIFVNVSTDMILDINGYYASSGVGVANTFLGLDAGNFTMTGNFNTGIGQSTLSSNTTGHDNTATGNFALHNNTTGVFNTATGAAALGSNTTGIRNTSTGGFALSSNTVGISNTATGYGALGSNTTGYLNTAIGDFALNANTAGYQNTAIGSSALLNATGNFNTAIGYLAGNAITTGNNNIFIGNPGVLPGESNIIRIGTEYIHVSTNIAGIYGGYVATGVPVLVDGSGHLGTMSSSRRAKENIRDIAGESDGLMKLRPVAFRYKPSIDATGLAQYGLIAEEVANVYPDLVVYDRDGRPETVRYHLVNALLLNEVQKQHRTVEAQEKTIEAQEKAINQQKETIDQEQAEIEALKARLSRLEARLLADSRP